MYSLEGDSGGEWYGDKQREGNWPSIQRLEFELDDILGNGRIGRRGGRFPLGPRGIVKPYRAP